MPNSNKLAKILPAASSFDATVEWLPITSLRPNPRNARTHSKAQLKLIQKSISAFGQIKPVIADDQNIILAGHGLVEAAKGLGLNAVAVLRFGNLTEAQKRAYLIADNKIAAEAGWNRELLAIELPELAEILPAEGLDVSLTGFQAAEIDLLLGDMSTSDPEDEGKLPQVPKDSVSTRGDIWQLGKHRLLCGDFKRPLQLQNSDARRSRRSLLLRSPIQCTHQLDRWPRQISALRIRLRLGRNEAIAIPSISCFNIVEWS